MSSTINQDIASSISSARINKEKRFQIYGVAALLFAMIMLVTLFITIFSKGLSAFIQTKVNLDIELTQEVIDPEGSRDLNVLKQANYQKLIDDSLKLYALNLFEKICFKRFNSNINHYYVYYYFFKVFTYLLLWPRNC